MSGPVEIPMFDFDESLVVESMFDRNGIRWHRDVIHLGASVTGGRHAFAFRVPEEQFTAAVAVLKEAFGIRTGDGGASGTCPACGAALTDASRCPDCGLNVSGDYTGLRPKHPFVRFLKQNDLL
jgi:hypothetical protein